MTDITPAKIKEILRYRGIEKIYPSKETLKELLESKKRLAIYHGVDPTAPHLHLGHSTNYFLLRDFQKLGHRVVLLIGDFTARIGDPTGRLTARKALTEEEVRDNSKTYQKQVGKFLNFNSSKNPAELRFNSQWLERLTLKEINKLASNFTYQQIIKRNMFKQRLKRKEEIYLHEFLYPLLQGYDSVALNADIEVGGNDQTFNMLVGRDLMKVYKNKEKFVITTKLLVNPKTGKKLMSKSEGSFIALDDSPKEMYGKIMALPDEVIITCFELCTEISLREIDSIKKGLKSKKLNPRDAKARLAREIVTIYCGAKKAQEAEKEFERIFKTGKKPSKIRNHELRITSCNILDLLVKLRMVPSKAEARRLIQQKGVKIDDKIVEDWKKVIKIKDGIVVQVGKRRFIKIKLIKTYA